jgi:four helix bundle protein
MALAKGFRELNVYVKTREEVRAIFILTRKFPSEERFSMTDQIRRSSRAVKAMIAEAWARRRYEAAFISKLTEAMGEAMETQAWLDDALDCGYIDATTHRRCDDSWQHIGAMLGSMIANAGKFCGNCG